MTIIELKHLKESEHKVEFKEAHAQYNYNNGRRSVLGYIVALANEGGGMLILARRRDWASGTCARAGWWHKGPSVQCTRGY